MKRINSLFAFALIILIAGGITSASAEQSALVRISPGINLSAEEVQEAISSFVKPGGNTSSIEILVYYFSSGIESTSYKPDGSEVKINSKGIMKAAVKIRKNGRLGDVIFVYASGRSKKDILNEFASEIKKNLLPLP